MIQTQFKPTPISPSPQAERGLGGEVNLLTAAHVGYQLNRRELLHDVSLSLHGGEVVGLIGPNGAGKSTLLKVLSGLWSGASSKIDLCGKPLAGYRPREIARMVAMVAQSATLDAAFTVRDVVLMGRNPYLSRFQVEGVLDRQIAEESMRATDTLSLAERAINTLSGGERQRVFLARALAQQPSILLLDEPTSNLDVRHQLDILTLARNLSRERGIGVLIAIHELSLAARFCDRLALLYHGQIVAEGDPVVVLTPDNLSRVFGVLAQTYYDPYTHDLKLSILGSDERGNDE